MKKLILILFFLQITSTLMAQMDTIPMPPGYSLSQLRLKSCLRVSPDNHLWVGFTSIGAGEYDGVNWKMWTDTNGLPSNKVSSFAFDSLVRWIGTDSGLVKIAGINLLTFHTGNSSMPSNKVKCLFMGDTSLWVGTDRGVVSVSNNYWVQINKANSPILSDTITSICSNTFGIYFATKLGVSILTSAGWSIASPNVGPVARFTNDMHGNIFWKKNKISDSVFTQIHIPSDPCLFDYVHVQPEYFIGATTNNKMYALSGPDVLNSFLLEFDSTLNKSGQYFMTPMYPDPLTALQADSFQLFDINLNGELFTTDNSRPILRTLISGLQSPQVKTNCPFLDINQVQARINNSGSNFWNLSGEGQYEVPKSGGRTAIFSEGLWLGGKDPQGHLHLAAQTYRQSGTDFWPGPLDTTNATTNLVVSQQYDSLWKIDRYTINVFIGKYLDGSVANGSYTIPDIILNWPVSGTGNYSHSLAPYIDYNSDGHYNPFDGDYPDIKGDQMIWWVFNDNLANHSASNSPNNLGVEIHASAYAYNCPTLTGQDTVINYTTFYHYEFFNRSDTTYSDVYSGIYADVDLGYYADDYIGCDTSLDIAFVYNGDNFDENVDTTGYGLNPPMMNLAYLKGPQPAVGDGIDNNHNGTIDEPGELCMMNTFIYDNNDFSVTGNPVSPSDYYNFMIGSWKDGLPLTYGGNGYDPASTNTTHYAYSADPYSGVPWSEFSPCNLCQSNNPSDRRLIVASGPFDLPAHNMRSIDYAYVYTREPNAPNGQNTSWLLNHDQVVRIKHFFDTDSFPCKHLVGVEETVFDSPSINLYPNPAHSTLHVNVTDKNNSALNYYVTDITGRRITSTKKIISPSFEINLTNISSGAYFLIVESKTGKGFQRFVVQ